MICGATFIDPLTWTPFAMLSHGLPLTRAHGPDTRPSPGRPFPFPSAIHLLIGVLRESQLRPLSVSAR